MNVDDCYRELGLEPGSSEEAVKAAYRRLAARWHPDRNDSQQALRKIQRINRAVAEIRRARGADAAEGAARSPAFEQDVELSLEDLLAGCTRELRGERVDDCADCAGTGLQPHASPCGECGGAGKLQPHPFLAWFTPPVPCGACNGRGSTRLGCTGCDATGKTAPRRWKARVSVPRGARLGTRIEATARFDRAAGGGTMPLHVTLGMQAHPLFSVARDGTVQCTQPVDGYAWVANRWVEVPTPSGMQQMRLQRGHLAYRIKGAGMPWGEDGACGDCIVTVEPLFPQALDAAQEAMVDALVAANTGAECTPEGVRMAAWQRALKQWQEGQA